MDARDQQIMDMVRENPEVAHRIRLALEVCEEVEEFEKGAGLALLKMLRDDAKARRIFNQVVERVKDLDGKKPDFMSETLNQGGEQDD